MRLSLPRDAISVPVIRRVLRVALVTLAVHQDCISDIEVALTEACTNVLDHAETGDQYQVAARLRDDKCVIDVIDNGSGFDATRLGLADADSGAEAGRGLQLIRALVDNVQFSPVDGRGSVHFEKALVALDGSPYRSRTSPADPVVLHADESLGALQGSGPASGR
ncbi:MAG TPA: ATP-binding protein [Mycobacteriales bacterium]|nr:ATP-binding protein [Mycobacteriales bacterium]